LATKKTSPEAKPTATLPNLREGRGGKPTTTSSGQLHTWFASHPDALAVVDEWLRLRALGETPWSLRDVIAELRLNHSMPQFGDSGVRNWLEKNRTEQYCRGAR
jgi:hypothetical protein